MSLSASTFARLLALLSGVGFNTDVAAQLNLQPTDKWFEGKLVYSDTGVESGSHLHDLVPGRLYVIDWTFNAALRDGEYNFSAMASIPLDLQVSQVEVCDFVPFALQFRVARGLSLPIYAATHWENVLSITSIE